VGEEQVSVKASTAEIHLLHQIIQSVSDKRHYLSCQGATDNNSQALSGTIL
jgi:hypothetical protein